MTLKLRPAVRRFAEAMEMILRENDHKNGWENMDHYELLGRIDDERDELLRAVDKHIDGRSRNITGILKESVDVANFAMMIYDNALPPGRKTEG